MTLSIRSAIGLSIEMRQGIGFGCRSGRKLQVSFAGLNPPTPTAPRDRAQETVVKTSAVIPVLLLVLKYINPQCSRRV
jgi:hypothetical protein